MSAHPVALRGPAFLGRAHDDDRPVVLQRTDQDFLDAVLRDLGTEAGRRALRDSLAERDGARLRLYRPVHRTFHLVVVEAHCLALGAPRLDPRRVEAAGVVVRRVVDGVVQGWMRGDDGFRGWLPLSTAEQHADPDPAKRPRASAGHPDVDRLLVGRAGLVGDRAEAFTPLYVAPPETCRAAGQTLLYGLLPLGASETTAAPPDLPFTFAEARDFLPGLLRRGVSASLPSAGGRLYPADADRQDAPFRKYLEQLEQLYVQLDLEGTGPLSKKLRDELKAVQVEYADDTKGTALDHLRVAIRVLVNRDGASGVRMPKRWPPISSAQERRFTELLRDIYTERLATFAPCVGRFDRPDAAYELRTFVRVRNDDGCPPTLHWSKPSERFTLAPWYDNGPVPPLTIQLPDITRESVKKLRPNVAFQVPGGLFNLLRANDPRKLAAGEGKQGPSSPMVAWICGFNIPVITLCAFIVLSIFLSLFHLLFFWLPFIKICLPIPASWTQKR